MTNTELQRNIYRQAYDRLVEATHLLNASSKLYPLEGVKTEPSDDLIEMLDSVCTKMWDLIEKESEDE